MKTLDTLEMKGKRVFLRVDLNVPLDAERKVADDTRIRAVLPSLNKVLDEGGRAILASHLGRPKGQVKAEFSLRPVAEHLGRLLGREVTLAPDCVGDEVRSMVAGLGDGDLVLLENLRFHAGEQKDDPEFARRLAALCDIYVNDAFAVCHRAHASVHGITRFVSQCGAGYQLQKELDYYHQALESPSRPLAVIIGGAKVSTKIGVLEHLMSKVDSLLIGGAMANTFLKAQGKSVGSSLVENEFVQTAGELLQQARQRDLEVRLPIDVVVAPSLRDPQAAKQVSVDRVPDDQQILDVGSETIKLYQQTLDGAATIVWNGPLGAFEIPPFHQATFAIAEYLGRSGALTVIGGGDSASAVRQAGVAELVSYVSTGGGAFLELLEGKTLPGVAALEGCGE